MDRADYVADPQALAGFSDPTVILIAGLCVVSMGLESSGITTWIGQQLITHAGASRTRLFVIMLSIVALLTALISVNGAVAALMPMVVIVAVRLGRPASQLLMPLAFAAHAGSQLTLTGSPVNVLNSEALGNTSGERLLPFAETQHLPKDLGQVPAQFKDRYFGGGDLWYVTVKDSSYLVGQSLTAALVEAHKSSVGIIMVQNNSLPHKPGEIIESLGTLILRGQDTDLERFCLLAHLERSTRSASLVTPTTGVPEVMVAPRSTLVGEKVFPGMITESGQLVIAAIQRAGQDPNENECAQLHITLREGDLLLLKGTWSALSKYTVDDSVLVVDEPDEIRQQAAPLGKTAWVALLITTAMIVFLTIGVVPAAVVTAIAALAMVLSRTASLTKAHRSISWTTIILVAAMIPMSTAIAQSGAADLIASGIAYAVAGQAPQIVLLRPLSLPRSLPRQTP